MKAKIVSLDNTEQLKNSQFYTAIIQKLEELNRDNFWQSQLGIRCKNIASILYQLSDGKDVNISIAGLIYHLSFSNDKWQRNIEALTETLNQDIQSLLKTLNLLNFQILTGLKNQINNDFEIDKIITMIFVSLGSEKQIRALIIELVHRLITIKKIDKDLKKDRFILDSFRIFVPIANRLGLWNIKWQLEDACFKQLESDIYYHITELIEETRLERDQYMSRCIVQIEKLIDNNIVSANENDKENKKEGKRNFKVIGRSKSIYSIYAKMKQLYCYSIGVSINKISFKEFNVILKDNLHKLFEAVHDLFGIRIICNSESLCYEILNIIQKKYSRISTFRRQNGELVDYINQPKSNGYQSLHLVVLGPEEKKLEIQIRTYEMDAQAEYGIAAHWKYKELGQSHNVLKKDYAFIELRKFIDKNGISVTQDILSNIDPDFFNSNIYVFTPDGNIITLPNESTPVDFAYSIHTEIGDKCIGARVKRVNNSINNERMVTLDSHLCNGDIVQILTQNNAHPNISWLEFVKTTKAKEKIKHWIKYFYKNEFTSRGRESLEKALIKHKIKISIKSKQIEKIAKKFNYQSIDDLLAGIAYDNSDTSINKVINLLLEEENKELNKEENKENINPEKIVQKQQNNNSYSYSKDSSIIGIEGLMYHIAGCCNPIPREPIVGVVTTHNRGISIHSQTCPHLKKIPNERHVKVSWNSKDTNRTYPLNLQIEANDRIGLMRDICSYLADDKINISEIQVLPSRGNKNNALINLRIEVRDDKQLQNSIYLLKTIADILTIKRIVK